MDDTIPRLLAAQSRALGPRPLLTFRTAGERTELSYATFENWVAKTANWLVEEHDRARGSVVDVDAAAHWRALVALLAAWHVGAAARVVPGGCEAGDEVLAYADDHDGSAVTGEELAVAGDGETQRALVAAARSLLPSRARLLTTAGMAEAAAGRALVAVLSAGGSLLWCPDADAETAATVGQRERATHVAAAGGVMPL